MQADHEGEDRVQEGKKGTRQNVDCQAIFHSIGFDGVYLFIFNPTQVGLFRGGGGHKVILK